jgi:hypothetical protein
MSKTTVSLLAIAVVCLIVSFAVPDNDIIDGMGKALFGVFVIMFFIIRFFGDEEPHHGSEGGGAKKAH